MNRSLAAMALLLGLASAGCVDRATPAAAAPGPVVATVGNEGLSQALFDHYAKSRSGLLPAQLDEGLRASLLEDLKQLSAAAQVAGVHPDPDTRQELALKRLEVLAHAGARAAGVYETPSAGEIRQAYDDYVGSLPASEYRVAHILVATEEVARGLVAKLEAHADFGKLASTESADESRTRGGDLGWITPGKLPAAITDAVATLKPGQVTGNPVHTPYGWHVIKLLEARAAVAPPFEQVRAQLAENVIQERYRRFLAECLQKRMQR
jgi:peptidyl-prolyl cis-trans isomerase C